MFKSDKNKFRCLFSKQIADVIVFSSVHAMPSGYNIMNDASSPKICSRLSRISITILSFFRFVMERRQ